MESLGFVLPPIAERFHVVDILVPPNRPEEQLAAAWYALTHVNRTLMQTLSEPVRIAYTAWCPRRSLRP
ncbi:hypothetical protein [Streptomyces xantholiticus]|uniref:hypothetical protein n=1 Tax=Streptomyces xantholiticus TaxID=68285 RepID=UPI0016774464|nr:hypothetical protein [Streptomyces xantholiticus]GGW71442.1 hypothetical protein GCM10010381_65200 [Streptomyces xantholiticus]